MSITFMRMKAEFTIMHLGRLDLKVLHDQYQNTV